MKQALFGIAAIAAVMNLAPRGAQAVGAASSGVGAARVVARKGIGVGTVAPDFALPDQNNKTHKLSENRGKITVLAFYPGDMTPGCTLEARSITQSRNEFEKNGIKVFGISVQDVASKRKFCEIDGINYPLLADVQKKVAESYGVLGPKGVAQRVSFIVAANGKIVSVDRSVNVRTHAKDLLKLINANKTKWSVAAPGPAVKSKAPVAANSAAKSVGGKM